MKSMSRQVFGIALRKVASLRGDCHGAVLMLTLSIFLFLYIVCTSVYAVGLAVNEKIRLQNVCDAAAYSAAVVQADSLSRIATINRALSWCHINLTRMQMDYIVYQWLKLTCKHFKEDMEKAKDWNKKNPEPPVTPYQLYEQRGIIRNWEMLIRKNCSEHHGPEGANTWWIGWEPSDHKIRLGYDLNEHGVFADYDSLAQMLDGCARRGMESEWENGIGAYKECIMGLNIQNFLVCNSIANRTTEAIFKVVKSSIPDAELSDYRLLALPLEMHFPYGQNTNALIPYYNTEEDELELLSMCSPSVHLHELFGDGIDQWFPRQLTPGEQINDVSEDVYENLLGEGIQRGYRSANCLRGPQYAKMRGNHVSTGAILSHLANMAQMVVSLLTQQKSPGFRLAIVRVLSDWRKVMEIAAKIAGGGYLTRDIEPSCHNAQEAFPEQCREIEDNYGLVAEYHWAAMQWWCVTQVLKWERLGVCGCPWSCHPCWKFFFLSFKDLHFKYNPLVKCKEHGYGNYSSQFTDHKRDDYRNCAMGLDSSLTTDTGGDANGIPGTVVQGYSRVYGDDTEIYDDQYYQGARVWPVKIGPNFFRSANIIGLAKRQQNLLGRVLSGLNEEGQLPANNLYSLFNAPKEQGNWVVALAASRPAFRERDAKGRPINAYQTKYSLISSLPRLPKTAVERQNNDFDQIIRLAVPDELSQFRTEYRLGCPHEEKNNKIDDRLKMTWNLCETDWDGVLLPLRYVNLQLAKNLAPVSIAFDGLKGSYGSTYHYDYPTTGIYYPDMEMENPIWLELVAETADKWVSLDGKTAKEILSFLPVQDSEAIQRLNIYNLRNN